jgi:hypothetical protein
MSRNISDLRELLFNTIADVRSGAVDVEKAKIVNELSKTIVESAKVEVDFIRQTDAEGSGFLEHGEKLPDDLPAGIVGRLVHRAR